MPFILQTKLIMKIVFGLFFIFISLPVFAQKTIYTKWEWQKSNCQDCGIHFKVQKEDLKNKKTVEFLQAIATQKKTILSLYKSDSQEYNLLAHMAYGILGNESEYFQSFRYFIKRNSQLAITTAKKIDARLHGEDDIEANSKGPTQIKKVPTQIAEHYKITEKDLWKPFNAAISTMGYLIEALRELKQRTKNNNWEFVTRSTYVDYLPYLYFGGVKKLLNRTATPETNIYVKNMKQHMLKIQIYEIKKQ